MPNIQALQISLNGFNDITRKKKKKKRKKEIECLWLFIYFAIWIYLFLIWYSRATPLACTRALLQCGYNNLQIHSNISKGTKKTYQISYPRKLLEWKILNLKISSLRKHPFLLETPPAAKSEEKRMFSKATKYPATRENEHRLYLSI